MKMVFRTTIVLLSGTVRDLFDVPASGAVSPETALDAAQCASDNCLTQCLSGDSSGCDTCRMNNNCNQPVPTCAGFPSPF